MGEFGTLGRLLMLLGLAMFAIGALLACFGRVPWLGRMPGDFVYQGRNWKLIVPLGTSLAISLLLTFLMWLFRRR